jgi:selenide,water dikinase
LLRDRAGFLRVDACLRAVGREDVFVAGDAASFDESPLPKAGVFAVRQGPVLARNLRAVAEGQAPRPYRPQKEFLVLLSLGDGHALGTRSGFVFGGRWVWWLKDQIDRRFMARYQGA